MTSVKKTRVLSITCLLTVLACPTQGAEPHTRYLVTFDRPFWVRVGDGYVLIEAAEGQYTTNTRWQHGLIIEDVNTHTKRDIGGHWITEYDGSFQATRVIDSHGTAYQCTAKLWAHTAERVEIK